jgi:hypothetical protein
MTVEQMFFMQA